MADRPATVLLTGASGYIGGRLLGVLERAGRRVRCLARRPGDLAARAAPSTAVVRGDVLDRASLDAALQGVDAAYYLVHAMGSAGDFEAEEQAGARNFADAARAAGVGRIIYLGGLAAGGAGLSAHLRSRRQVGDVLRGAAHPGVRRHAAGDSATRGRGARVAVGGRVTVREPVGSSASSRAGSQGHSFRRRRSYSRPSIRRSRQRPNAFSRSRRHRASR